MVLFVRLMTSRLLDLLSTLGESCLNIWTYDLPPKLVQIEDVASNGVAEVGANGETCIPNQVSASRPKLSHTPDRSTTIYLISDYSPGRAPPFCHDVRHVARST